MIHRRSIVYNIQWCGIIYVCTYTRVTHTEKRKSKIFRGLRPLDPRQGLCPCTPPGALRRAPGPHPKSARAYALAMCAPRTCLPPPPKKKIGSRLRARYVRSAHMFAQKKSDPSNSKKSARASRSLCALRAHVCPPIINRCPLLAPHFLNPGAATDKNRLSKMADLGIIFHRRKHTIHWYQPLFTVITGSMPFRYFWATLYIPCRRCTSILVNLRIILPGYCSLFDISTWEHFLPLVINYHRCIRVSYDFVNMLWWLSWIFT